MDVVAATRAFGSELRVRLIRHYQLHPGSQADAARALGVNTASITRNTQTLIETGVVVEVLDEDPAGSRRGSTYTVDLQRHQQLLDALGSYPTAPE